MVWWISGLISIILIFQWWLDFFHKNYGNRGNFYTILTLQKIPSITRIPIIVVPVIEDLLYNSSKQAQLLATRFALDKSLIKGNYSPLCFEDLCIEFSAESLYGMYSSFFPYSSPPFAKDFSLRDGLLEVVWGGK